jgi:tetratricopeptide (TPR) repeat protein
LRAPLARLVIGLAGLAMVAACSHTASQARTRFEQGRDAYNRGDVLDAYRLLQGVAAEPAAQWAGEYAQLQAKVTTATEHLVERWLERANFWLEEGQVSRALVYFDDLIDQLPSGGALRAMLTERSAPARARLEELRQELAKLYQQAQAEFEARHIAAARQRLLEARWLANENHLEFGLAQERLLDECDRRLPGRLEELHEADAPDSVDVDRLSARNPRSAGPGKRPRQTRRLATARPKPQAEQPSERAQVSEAEQAYRRGLRSLDQGKKVDAILHFRRALELDPRHREAGQALERLEPYRKKKIEFWMRKAAEFFAREQLEQAAPYYQKVLLLDPDNLRAKEGQLMYQRLKELKNQQH